MSLNLLAQSFNDLLDEWDKRNEHSPSIQKEIEEIKQTTQKYNDEFIDVNIVWEDILAKLKTNKFCAISALGGQGSGKSTLGMEFVKKALDDGFAFAYALPEDFLNDVDSWVAKVLPLVENNDRICIMADDLSYSTDTVGRKKQAIFKNFVARIRHILGIYAKERGKKLQVFIMYVTHRLHATPPMLRNSGSWIFTEMQSADRDDCLEIIGKSKEQRERLELIYSFLNDVIYEGAKKGIIKFTLDGNDYSFKWGTEEDKGDGRLMCIYHAGKLNIYNAKAIKEEIDFEKYRFKCEEIKDAE